MWAMKIQKNIAKAPKTPAINTRVCSQVPPGHDLLALPDWLSVNPMACC
jgi:hypothetical protein